MRSLRSIAACPLLSAASGGLEGAGEAFFVSYLFHFLMVYLIGRKLTNFSFHLDNITTNILYLALILVVFFSCFALPAFFATGVGLIATGLSGAYSLVLIVSLISMERAPKFVDRLLIKFKVPKAYVKNGVNDLQSGTNILEVQNRIIIHLRRSIWIFVFLIFLLIIINRYMYIIIS